MSINPWPADLALRLQREGVRDVECLFPDVSGYPRGKLMPAASFAAGQELRIAQAMPMQCVTGEYSYDPIFADADPDVRLVPDPATLRVCPGARRATWPARLRGAGWRTVRLCAAFGAARPCCSATGAG
jgi:glutamine synthetase